MEISVAGKEFPKKLGVLGWPVVVVVCSLPIFLQQVTYRQTALLFCNSSLKQRSVLSLQENHSKSQDRPLGQKRGSAKKRRHGRYSGSQAQPRSSQCEES